MAQTQMQLLCGWNACRYPGIDAEQLDISPAVGGAKWEDDIPSKAPELPDQCSSVPQSTELKCLVPDAHGGYVKPALSDSTTVSYSMVMAATGNSPTAPLPTLLQSKVVESNDKEVVVPSKKLMTQKKTLRFEQGDDGAGGETSSEGDGDTAGRRVSRSGSKLGSMFRTLGKRGTGHVASSFSHIPLYRRQSDVFASSRGLPSPVAPRGSSPIFTQHLTGISIAHVAAGLRSCSSCATVRFLREIVGCEDIVASDWNACPAISGTQVRKICYTVAVPDDVPAIIRRLTNMPDKIAGASVWRMRQTDDEILLTQQSYSREVMYGDRMKVQSTFQFQEDYNNDVTLTQWVEVLWDKPLPWTHRAVTMFVEKRAVSDAVSTALDFARILKEAPAGNGVVAHA